MSHRNDARLGALFLGALAAACGARAPDPVPVALPEPSATPTSSGEVIAIDRGGGPRGTATPSAPPDSPQAYARSFVGLKSLASAVPGAELLGFVEDRAETVCTVMPCPADWIALTARLRPAAIVKRKGKLEAITGFQALGALAPIDTPEKAAVLVRLTQFPPTTTCTQVRADGWACAPSSFEGGIPVRRGENGTFEVMTHGTRNVCTQGMYGSAEVLGVMSVAADGKVEALRNTFVEKVEDVARGDGGCHYPTRGRPFEGFRADDAAIVSELDYHLRAAREEAAAVVAFERLARELAAHGAPTELVDEARRAADDERRHARIFRRLASRMARALGVPMPSLETGAPSRFGVRALVDVLLENAREGCANETFAAIVVTHQASHARRTNRVFAAIAADERRHAALAYRVHAWGLAASSTFDAARVERARRDAIDALQALPDPSSLGRDLGEPSAHTARHALARVVEELLQRAA